MSLHQQVERIAGCPVPVFTPEDIQTHFGLSAREFRERADRFTRIVNIREYIAGSVRPPPGRLFFLVSDYRDGFLVQLVELLR